MTDNLRQGMEEASRGDLEYRGSFVGYLPNTPRYRLRWNAIRNAVTHNALHIPRRIRWFIQRGRRGWADCDVWNWASYMSRVNMMALTELRSQSHGHPAELEPHQWDAILTHMIDGFAAHIAIDELVFMSPNEEGGHDIDNEWGDRLETTRVNGLAAYATWFPHLWD